MNMVVPFILISIIFIGVGTLAYTLYAIFEELKK